MRTPSVLRLRSTSHESNGPADRAHRVVVVREPLAERGVAGDERTADHVGVPAEVLRRRVHDDVGAEGQRTLQVGRGEGVVDGEQRPGLVRHRRRALDVGDVEQRVARCLAPDDPRRRPHRRPQRIDVVEVGRRVLEAPLREHPGDQPEGAAVGIRRPARRGRRGGRPCAAGCPPRRGRRRRPAPSSPLPARRAPRAARRGSGCRCGCTRSPRAGRRRRPACRWWSGAAGGSPRRSPGRAPGRRGWPAC